MENKYSKKVRKARGSGLAEAAVAAIVLIPLALGMLDIIFIVLANTVNDTACKNAARAAANETNGTSAMDAALKSLSSFQPSSILTKLELISLDIPQTADSVACKTKIDVVLPVPVPGISKISFMANAVEPIVVKQQ
jgi:uncharacterized membrane protein YhiD involved in acid resistance